MHALKRRLGRAPGRSGKPLRPMTTRLPEDEDRKLRAIVKARGITVFRFLQEAARAAMAGIEIEPPEHSRENYDALAGAGLISPRRDPPTSPAGAPLPRLRERDAGERRLAAGPPAGRDRPTTLR